MAATPPQLSTQSKTPTRLPELFGHKTQLLGWQGITLTIPIDWNLAAFSGDFSKGNLRLADDEGLRMELVWEEAKVTPSIERSVEVLLHNLGREAKKKKHSFDVIENPKLLSRARREHEDKDQLTSFGWIGVRDQPVAHGWGAAWHCSISNRVIVAHILGRGTQNSDKTRRLAGEILNSCCSHAEGGWQIWSVFGLQLEVPEEFQLLSAKLQTGRLELDWERTRPLNSSLVFSPKEWGKNPERISLRRLSAANVVLEHEILEEWSRRVAAHMFKPYRWSAPKEERVLGTHGFRMQGALRDLRRRFSSRLLDRLMHRQRPAPQALVWQDESVNKIFVALFDLESKNSHVARDALDSLQNY